MTLTFTGYDQSQDFLDFIAKVKAAQGFVSHAKYGKLSKAVVELTAFVPEQPELICPPSTGALIAQKCPFLPS
jgi:hypothetical protein